MMMKGDSDTITVKQAQRTKNPERTGAQNAPERCYKGKDETCRISNVIECIDKIFIPLVEILRMDTQTINGKKREIC